MSLPGERPDEQEIAVGLAQAVVRALDPGAGALDLKAARDVSQILVLDGLDRVLRHFEPHLGRELPVELAAVRDRLLRMSMRALETGDIHEFRVTGAELEALAGDLGAMEWSSAGTLGPDVATVTAARALEDLPGAAEAGAAIGATRLAAPVAARLRAALDWLAGPDGFAHPITARADDSLLEVSCPNVDPSGMGPARFVLADVDGLIGPGAGGRGGWQIRVPAVATREHFLMIERGGIRIALPWHAVLRLQVLPTELIEERAAEAGVERIDPLPFANPASQERPVVTVGHGARRAWLAADRLVWRLAAMPGVPDDAMRGAGFERAVRTEEDELYAVAPLARWLEHVAEPAWPMERPMPVAPAPAPAAVTPASVPDAVAAESVPARASTPAPVAAPDASLVVAPASARSPEFEAPAAAVMVPTPELPVAMVTPLSIAGATNAPPPAPAIRAFRPIRIETDIIAPEPRVAAAVTQVAAAPPAPVVEMSPPPPPALPVVAPAPVVAPPAPQQALVVETSPAVAPAPVAIAPQPPVAIAVEPEPRTLSIFHVEPLAAPPAPTPANAPLPAPAIIASRFVEPAPVSPARSTAAGSGRRALVAADSLMARIFLTRQIEQCGIAVTTVTRAAEVDAALRNSAWSLILADVELPDARGEGFMRALRLRAEEAGAPLIAMVRDRDDRVAADAAGVSIQLRKPIEPDQLRGLLRTLALIPESA